MYPAYLFNNILRKLELKLTHFTYVSPHITIYFYFFYSYIYFYYKVFEIA